MKRLFVLVAVFFSVLQVCAQDKYAFIFSRPLKGDYPGFVELNKEVSRNNISVISHALTIQRFKPAHITIDSTGSIRKNILSGISAITKNIKKGDFVFLYFDIPLVMDKVSNEPVFAFANGEPEDQLSLVELNQVLKKIALKAGDASLFFTLIDAEVPAGMKMPADLFNQYIFAGSPGEPNLLIGKNSAFSLAIEKSLQSISTFNDSYDGLFNNIKRNLLLYTTQQNPLFVSPDHQRAFFNNQAVRFARHYDLVEKINDSTFIINAGQRMNIAPGIEVDFFPAYTDTAGIRPDYRGEVISVNAATAMVRLDKGLLVETGKLWAYVTEYDLSKVERKIKFNELYSGDANQLTFFRQLVAELKKPLNANYTRFVTQGGDIQVGNIVRMADGKFEVSLLNPQTEQLIAAITISSSKDVQPVVDLTKKLAQYEYISKLTNYIPELAVDFQMTDADGQLLTEKENGYDILYEGDEVAIRIINRNPHKLYYSLIDLTQDKNYTIITGQFAEDNVLLPNSEKILPVTITAPFGKERVKLFTSMAPFSLGDFQTSYTRSAESAVSFSDINIQDYDFEARSSLYARSHKQKNDKLSITVKDGQAENEKTILVRNPSSERVYFNLFRQREDGSYDQIFPGKGKGEKSCYVDYGATATFQFADPLNPYDQLVTVYADRPFNLIRLANEDKGLNDLFADIAKNGRIPGTALNKIGLAQALFQPRNTTTMRDGETIFIKLITPKVSNERGITIPAPSQQYDINGFAMSVDNKPVKSLKINNEPVNYDASLKFFEHTVNLSYGVNKVVIEAVDEKGFTAIRTLEFELKNNNTVVAGGQGKNYFLGIGIDNYKTWPVLNNARNDVVKFAELLKTKYGFDSSFLLLDEQATRKNIINKIREFLKKAGPNDNVVIYLSGHGNEDQLADGDYYFIPQEAEADDVTGAVKSTDIVDNFKKIRAKRCLLIVDACYSGMITNSVSPSGQPLTSGTDLESAENASCKWIVTSGRATKVSDGEKGKNSPFATVLINYLREHEDDASLKMPRLIDILKEKVKALNKQQEPFGMPIEGRGEWIFRILRK
jgi:hypothetical protein